MVDRLVGADVIADLKDNVLPAGLRDVVDWTDTRVAIMRRDDDTGAFGLALECDAISIRMNKQSQPATGQPETSQTGTLKVWADAGEGIIQGDRFNWDGRVCVITMVRPMKLGVYVAVDFRILEGNDRG